LGIQPNPQSPIPNPQSPIPNPQSPIIISQILSNIITLKYQILIKYKKYIQNNTKMSEEPDINQNNLDFDINLQSTTAENTSASSSVKVQSVSVSKDDISTSEPKQQISSSDKIDFTNFLSKANNPGIVFFTLFFKALAMVSFLFLGIFNISEALIFIFVVILNSLDFWFVKNISGRILVGLRWWNEVKEDGTEEWKFESSHEVKAKSIDTTIFWVSLYVAPIFWGIFFVLELIGLKLMWTLACLIGFILTGSNTFGYYKCSGDQEKKVKGFLSDKTQEGFNKILQFGASALANNNK